MSVEEQVRAGLAALAQQVRPQPDPVGRLLARRRHGWRWRTGLTAAVAALAVSATALVVSLAPGGPADPVPGYIPWTMRVVNAEPRGGLAGEPGFVTDLTSQLQHLVNIEANDPLMNGFHDDPPFDRRVRVLFVDDIGAQRVVIVALIPRSGSLAKVWEKTVLVEIHAPRGAAPAMFVAAAREQDDPGRRAFSALQAEPLVTVTVEVSTEPYTTARILLAPPQCQIATAASPALTDWRPEPTGSYLIRTAATYRAEWVRVTCDGVVRVEMPAEIPNGRADVGHNELTDQEMTHALAVAPGHIDPTRARFALNSFSSSAGYWIGAKPSIVWGDRLTFPGVSELDSVVVAAPLIGGGWIGVAELQPVEPLASLPPDWPPGYVEGALNSAQDPSDPTVTLAMPLGPGPIVGLFVLAPAGATEVRVTDQGQPLAQAPVRGRGAVVSLFGRGIMTGQGLRVEAVDATGRVLGTAIAGDGSLMYAGHGVGWDQ